MRITLLLPLAALVLGSTIASADIAPPNQCPHDATAGTSCQTDNGHEGTCEEKTRSHYLPPHDGEEPKPIVSKYMGCVEKAVKATAPPEASASGSVPAAPTSSKRGCNASGSGATTWLGASIVAALLWQVRRRRPTDT